jgi:hypothetical protein
VKIPRNAFLACCGVFALSLPALAGVTVNSPANDTDVTSPFTLSASAATCGGKSVTAMGYSFDSSSNTTTFNAQSIDKSISASTGTHTLHVKAWSSGSSCVSDVVITVKGTTSSSGTASGPAIPSYAQKVTDVQALSSWNAKHDSGGSGSSSGSTTIVI